jgi:hypothetical protein
MLRTPDGHGRLELTKFRNPQLVESAPALAPPNAPGLRSVMFTVDSVDDTVERLRAHGAELVGEVAQYEDEYRLCYVRGPAGIIVALAEELVRTDGLAKRDRLHTGWKALLNPFDQRHSEKVREMAVSGTGG